MRYARTFLVAFVLAVAGVTAFKPAPEAAGAETASICFDDGSCLIIFTDTEIII